MFLKNEAKPADGDYEEPEVSMVTELGHGCSEAHAPAIRPREVALRCRSGDAMLKVAHKGGMTWTTNSRN